MSLLPPPPTYTDDKDVWINWFTVVAALIDNISGGAVNHNDLLNIQGGGSTERYHLLNSEYGFVQNMAGAKGAIASITVTASPFTYTNSGTYDEDVNISGGTITSIVFQRGATTVNLPTSGMFRLNNGDSLIVTYTAAPTMDSIPR